MKGRFQIYNSALAALVTIKSFLCEDKIKILKGISNVVTNTKIEGRYEFIHKKPDVILDSAHNIAGIEQFLSEFKKRFR